MGGESWKRELSNGQQVHGGRECVGERVADVWAVAVGCQRVGFVEGVRLR